MSSEYRIGLRAVMMMVSVFNIADPCYTTGLTSVNTITDTRDQANHLLFLIILAPSDLKPFNPNSIRLLIPLRFQSLWIILSLCLGVPNPYLHVNIVGNKKPSKIACVCVNVSVKHLRIVRSASYLRYLDVSIGHYLALARKSWQKQNDIRMFG